MRLSLPERPTWRRRFAILPVFCDGEGVWLQWYWACPRGEWTEILFDDPYLPAPAEAKSEGEENNAE